MTAQGEQQQLEELLEFLKRTRGFDFRGYKRASLSRRINKRMREVQSPDYGAYMKLLESTPSEFIHLFNTILINVTSFFRDDVAWDYMRSDVIPRIVASKRPGESIRVWSAGCATGEEAYSLAMAFLDAMPFETARDCLKIYATDVDEDALQRARVGVYDASAMESLPPGYAERFFDALDGRFTFRKELRRLVIFGRNDLIQDAPISRIDLLVCRNTLMYFDAETQARILARFHFALNDDGVLFLGRAETLITHLGTFVPLDLKRRIFAKGPRPTMRDRLLQAPRLMAEQSDPPTRRVAIRLRDAALEAAPLANVLIDQTGALVSANAPARSLFALAPADVGRPFQDLELSYRPVELRSRIEQAHEQRAPVTITGVEWRTRTAERWFDVTVTPLHDDQGEPLGVSVSFVDVTANRELEGVLARSRRELENAYEELQATNEELETTNEELQSTVEELETTNEELQSTNEELETMNEELQATNEELQAMNDELRRSGDELNEANDFLASIFTSVRSAFVVLDRELNVLVWNTQAEEYWGLRGGEVEGTNFLALDIGFPVERIKPQLRACVAGEGESFDTVVDGINRRGRAMRFRVAGTPLLDHLDRAVRGVILFLDELEESPAT